MAQFGINKDPQATAKWKKNVFMDDPVSHGNKRGTISFATSGKNSRTSQLFFNYVDNSFLDAQGFSPFGHVIEGMEYIDALYGGYGEGGKGDGTDGKGPSQAKITWQGNSYLDRVFPKLSSILTAELIF
jgi:peptidyl-prolyl cis-trans isomerase A (cyclophilin A)